MSYLVENLALQEINKFLIILRISMMMHRKNFLWHEILFVREIINED
jgi:hypothetical protein